MKPSLIDQPQRDRFVGETDRNFSVVAPAGVGKTTAIVDRIVRIAESNSPSNPVVPRLVMVTYTRKAAQEMLLRARNEMVKSKKVSATTMAQLNQAYFGTIHSYCLNIVQRFALRMGLPPKLEILQNESELWAGFIRSRDVLVPEFPESLSNRILQLMPIDKLLELAKNVSPKSYSQEQLIEPFPDVDIQPILDIEIKGRAKKSILNWNKASIKWINDFEKDKCTPLPEFISSKKIAVGEGIFIYKKYISGGEDMEAAVDIVFGGVRKWLGEASLIYAQAISEEFRKYKLQQGVVTYDDIIHLAVQVVRTPEYITELRKEKPIILLDEAQDTDKQQFEVLMKVACPVSGRELPEQGRFSMVGDPQQAIYGGRTDVTLYEKIRKDLCDQGGAEHLSLAVTMRCDRKIVQAMNALMPQVLDNRNGQVSYVNMEPSPWAKEGQMLHVSLDLPEEKVDDEVYAQAFAQWLDKQSLETLRASGWEQVAILCPRKALLQNINEALHEIGKDTQVVSDSSIVGENPAFAWVTALFKVISNPYDSFEIVGILREIFAVSDGDIAAYVDRWFKYDSEHPINIVRPYKDDSAVYRNLENLAALRSEIERMSLHDALNRIVERTQLRERLKSIPGYKPEICLEMLDHIFELADGAEEQRQSPDEWVKVLEENLQADVSENTVRRGAIQLMTMHKSKGLGFDAVLLPFSYKSIGEKEPPYPKYYGSDNGTVIVDEIHKLAFGDLLSKKVDGKGREYARLAYVAMTRTRHSLVLFDDYIHVKSKTDRWPSLMDYVVEGKTENRSYIESLPKTLTGDPEIEFEVESVFEANYPEKPNYSIVKKGLETCWRRITPSSLANHSDSEFFRKHSEQGMSNDFEEGELEHEVITDPAAYGNWWHETMEALPWSEGVASCKAKAEVRLQECPNADRGSGEIEKFFNSELVQEIFSMQGQCYCEVPMLWGNREGEEAFEGFIDFLAVTSDRILLVDWKTDQQLLAHIEKTYQKQILAYRKALADTYGVEIKTCIYSTQHAEKLVLDA
jgi:ATP-dependent exoDNAse (exonuclease V) beta subunit